MKRALTVLLLLCSFWMTLPLAQATAPEEVPEVNQTEEPQAETPTEPAVQPEAAPEAAPEGETQTGPDLSALSAETAIHTMDVRVELDESGRATVEQTIVMAIVGEVETIRFSFPDGAKKTDIAGYWTKSATEHGVRYLSVSDRKGFSGTQTFHLSYTLNDLVSGGEASQVLLLPLLSLQDYQIGQLRFSVTLPQPFESKPRFSSGYYNTLVEDLMTVATDSGVVTGMMNQIMRDNETLSMNLVLPEGYFQGSYGESKLTPVMTTIILLLLAVTLFYWFRTLRNPPLRIQARTLPPDGVNPGDLPFLLGGGNPDFNMLVSHWAVLGYLSFYVNRSGHVILRRRMSMGNERRTVERKLFDLLFGGENLCDGASLRYKRVGEKAMAVIPRYWGKRIYEKRSGSPFLVRLLCCLLCSLSTFLAMDAVAPDKLHGFYLLISLIAGAAMGWMIFGSCSAYYLNDLLWTGIGMGCALLLLIVGGLGNATLVMLPVVAASLLLGWQTSHGGLRRPYGDEVIGQTLGFRRFLTHASEHHIMQMLRRDPQYFYKILPYAEAMGQGQKFVALFHDCQLEPCQWFESARGTPVSASAFYESYADCLDMLNISLQR